MIDHEEHTPDIDRLGRTLNFTHPDEVLHDREMSLGDKRAILAAWASDSHAVPNLPALRQLDSGAIVPTDAVLAALHALDRAEPAWPKKSEKAPFSTRPRLPFRTRWYKAARRRDRRDDDDPPPCPAAALPPGVELALRRRREALWAAAA